MGRSIVQGSLQESCPKFRLILVVAFTVGSESILGAIPRSESKGSQRLGGLLLDIRRILTAMEVRHAVSKL